MQSLDIISVNLWQILIAIANLAILFFIMKKFLYGPVQKMLANRQSALEQLYQDADKAKENALENQRLWQDKVAAADNEAELIIQKATDDATLRADKMIEEAKSKAEGIVRQAEGDAALRQRQATEGIKQEIVGVSAVLAEKLLEREINIEDHRNIIDSVIDSIGDDND